ncbi:MAG: hypothetical protein ACP5D1_12200 [Bacteroidales bacterium]
MEPDDLQKYMEQVIRDRNNRPVPDFEGYSPAEMYHLLYFPFGPVSPVRLQKMADTDYLQIPLLKQVKYLASLLAESGEVKLTARGYLPTGLVSDLYAQGFIKDELIELGLSRLYRETDCMPVNLTRILIELAGLAKKRKGKLSLTTAAEKILPDLDALSRLIFRTFATKFNWAYYDRYGDNQIGQLGMGFSLILLSKYGNERQTDGFYAEKYFKAFPDLLNSIETMIGTREEEAARCYSLRTFERFLDYFGLISLKKEGQRWETTKYVMKTGLFDKWVRCVPHRHDL